jgi:hypothetical protein
VPDTVLGTHAGTVSRQSRRSSQRARATAAPIADRRVSAVHPPDAGDIPDAEASRLYVMAAASILRPAVV